MVKRLGFQLTLAALAFCLCLCSQIILPSPDAAGVFMLEVSEIDFEQTELEEDLWTASVSTTLTGLIFSKHGSITTSFQATSLLPDSPPPKYT